MIEYGLHCRKAECWSAMPAEYLHQRLAVCTYRSLATASATTYELIVSMLHHYPFKTFLLISKSLTDDDRRKHAIEILKDNLHTACKLDPWTFDHLRKHGDSVSQLLSAASLADITVHAEHCEVDNIFTECNNSSIRKWVFYRPQQKAVQFEEASML